jgi:hypothetical protein
LTFDFESGLPTGWSVGGTQGWIIDGSRVHGGTRSAHSGPITHGNTSSMTANITVSRAARVAFWFNTSTEANFDWFEIYVDGTRQARWSGTNAWTQGAADLSIGTHTVEFRYVKDPSTSEGDDRVWIDDVRVEAVPAPIGFESGSLPAGFTVAGMAGWFVDTSRPRTGTYSARSGAIADSRQSILQRNIMLSSPAIVTFWYSVSSESIHDNFEVWIDGARRTRASGEVPWTFASYALAAGMHTLEWRYIKDISESNGSDRAWIDNLQTGETSPTPGPICGGP